MAETKPMFSNRAEGVLVSDITAEADEFEITNGESFPAARYISDEQYKYFSAVLVEASDDSVYEVVHVREHQESLIDGGAFVGDVLRGQEGTTARAWPAGTKFIHTLTAGALADYVQQVFAEQLAALDGNDIEY